ncbi:response regulator [bacterium]|nr:response regulator [bacterium]
MRIRCLIVDDEPLATDVIRSYLERFEEAEVTAVCNEAVTAMEILGKQKIDLLFLDIQMPLIKGTDFLRSLRHPPAVIFTTAYRDYALEGFDLDAVDYLLKPISFERFLQAMHKFFDRYRGESPRSPAVSPSRPADGEYLNVRSDRRTVRLPLADILYIEGMKDYVKVVTAADEVITNVTLQELEAMLPEERFLRIHRSYIVAVPHIRAFTSEMIEIANRQLPIGRYYKKQVMETLA